MPNSDAKLVSRAWTCSCIAVSGEYLTDFIHIIESEVYNLIIIYVRMNTRQAVLTYVLGLSDVTDASE